MDVTGTATHLDELGLETWTDLVRRLLDDDRAEVLEHQQEPIFIGVGTGTRLYRIAGSAGVGWDHPAGLVAGDQGVHHRALRLPSR